MSRTLAAYQPTEHAIVLVRLRDHPETCARCGYRWRTEPSRAPVLFNPGTRPRLLCEQCAGPVWERGHL